jgi:pimeloyl-ACP methyl ester carboxylesterase
MANPSVTVLLVHGAFADASTWRRVVQSLQADGTPVRAIANPLRGLSADARYVADVATQVDGPVLLVGHSYGGMVVTEAAGLMDGAVGLVYVAAFVPDIGDSVSSINEAYAPTECPPELLPSTYSIPGHDEPGVELSISEATFPTSFAGDLPLSTTRVAAVAQRPTSVACFAEPATHAAWRQLPSWAIVTTADQMIHPDAQRAMTTRSGSTVTLVDASHAVALSRPEAVADVIRTALATVA